MNLQRIAFLASTAPAAEQALVHLTQRHGNAALDQADVIYRYHWATTDARIKGQPSPAKLEGGVVQERHYVLNWLIGYMDQDWDDISTDT